MEPLTILIADDHPVFRKGLRALLTSMPVVELVGEATSGDEAIHLAEQLQPDVILMDLQMPGGGGLAAIRQEATRRCRTLGNRIAVVENGVTYAGEVVDLDPDYGLVLRLPGGDLKRMPALTPAARQLRMPSIAASNAPAFRRSASWTAGRPSMEMPA